MNWMLWIGIGCMIAGVLLVVFACMTAAKRADERMERLEQKWLDEHRNDPALHQAIEDYEDWMSAQRSDGGQDD